MNCLNILTLTPVLILQCIFVPEYIFVTPLRINNLLLMVLHLQVSYTLTDCFLRGAALYYRGSLLLTVFLRGYSQEPVFVAGLEFGRSVTHSFSQSGSFHVTALYFTPLPSNIVHIIRYQSQIGIIIFVFCI